MIILWWTFWFHTGGKFGDQLFINFWSSCTMMLVSQQPKLDFSGNLGTKCHWNLLVQLLLVQRMDTAQADRYRNTYTTTAAWMFFNSTMERKASWSAYYFTLMCTKSLCLLWVSISKFIINIVKLPFCSLRV